MWNNPFLPDSYGFHKILSLSRKILLNGPFLTGNPDQQIVLVERNDPFDNHITTPQRLST